MRISDWSSDVCSSDLDRPAHVIGAAHVSASEPASIRVLDREYTVGVEPGERDSLMTAAKLLDARLRAVRGANRMAAVDRVAVLAALNFTHELPQLRDQFERRDRALASPVGRLHQHGNCTCRQRNGTAVSL